jgi:hypothetical protein
VYVVGLDAVVHAIALKDGKVLGTLDLKTHPACQAPGMVYGSPVVHGGRLYLSASKANAVVAIGDK